jgi:hypothetical protein
MRGEKSGENRDCFLHGYRHCNLFCIMHVAPEDRPAHGIKTHNGFPEDNNQTKDAFKT